MIPSGSGEAGEEYDEYAWSEQKNNYERIGSAVKKADLSDFITKEFANSIVCTAAPVQTESVPAAGAALSVAVSSFARTPQEGDCFSALCKYGQTEKLYYVCAKILSVSASAVQAQVISSVGFDGADAAEIVLTEEQIAQYESADCDTTMTLSSDVDGTKKFVLLETAFKFFKNLQSTYLKSVFPKYMNNLVKFKINCNVQFIPVSGYNNISCLKFNRRYFSAMLFYF